MNGNSLILHNAMCDVVRKFGSQWAYCVHYEQVFGEPQAESTLSKKLAGHANWWMNDLVAVRMVFGETIIEETIRKMTAKGPRDEVVFDLIQHAAAANKEASEAVCAALKASSTRDKVSLSRAYKEAIENEDAARKLTRCVMSQMSAISEADR